MIPLFDMSDIEVISNSAVWKKPGDWFMTAYERDVLVALARSIKATSMIETGVQIGNAAKEILTNVASMKRYTGIDILPSSVPNMKQQSKEVPEVAGMLVKDDPRFKLLIRKNSSHDITPRDLLKCDMFLIDGDHSALGVVHDTYLADAVVRPGGFIIWHDYNEACVVQTKIVIEEMVNNGRDIRRIDNTWLAVERVK